MADENQIIHNKHFTANSQNNEPKSIHQIRMHLNWHNLIFFRNEEIFVQLDELMELDRLPMHEYDSTTASHKHRIHSSVMVKEPDC